MVSFLPYELIKCLCCCNPVAGKHAVGSGPSSTKLGPRQGKLTFKNSTESKKAADSALAKAFYVNHLPFHLVKDQVFRDALSAIARHGSQSGGEYTPPSMTTLREGMLDREKKAVQEAMVEKRGDPKFGGTLVADGWTDPINGHHIIAFLFVHKDGAEFLGSEDVTGLDGGGSGDHLASCLIRWIKEIGPDRIVHVCTDNAASCKAAGKIVEKQFPKISWTGCTSHSIDLLLEDFGKEDWVSSVCATGRTLVRFITRYTNLYHKLYEFSGGKKLVKPVETRFGTMFMMLRRLEELREPIERLATDPIWATCVAKCPDHNVPSLKDDIFKGNFWDDVGLVCKIMKPLYGLMILVDGNMPCAGKVYYHMYDCKQQLAETLEGSGLRKQTIQRLQQKFDERWDFLHTDIHAVGYILDPEFQSHAWMENAEVTGGFDRFVKRGWGPGFWLQAKKELLLWHQFPDKDALASAKDHPAHEFFQLFCSSLPKLQIIAYKVLPLVSSACSCERLWSIMGHVHSNRRNRLTHDRTNDLVFISQNLRMLYATADVAREKKYIEHIPGQSDECGEDEEFDTSYFDEIDVPEV